MIGALGTTLFFALTAVFANRAAQLLGSTRANLWRLIVATALLGLWAHAAGRGLGGVAMGWFFLGGVVGFGVGGVAMFQALPRLGSSLAMLVVQCGSAVAAALLEWLWLGTRLSPLQTGCAALTLLGVVLGLLPRSLPPVRPGVLRVGVAWAVLSALGQGAGAVFSRKAFAVAALAHERIDAGTAAYQRVLGGLLVAVIAFAIAQWWRPETVAKGRRAWPWVLANAATGPVLGVTCYQWALGTTPSGIVQPIVATSPLITIPLAAPFERSWPRPLYYAGAVLAVAGVAGLFISR